MKIEPFKVSTSLLFGIMLILNNYSVFLQTHTSINSFLFVSAPLYILGILCLFKKNIFTIDKIIFLWLFICLSVCFIQIINFGATATMIKYIFYMISFYIISKFPTENMWKTFEKTIFIISIIMIIDVVVHIPQIIYSGAKVYNIRNFTMLDKPSYTLILTFTAVIMLIKIVFEKNRSKTLLIIMLACLVTNIFIIQSKASIICLLIAMMYIIFLSREKRNIRFVLFSVIIAAIIIFSLNQNLIPPYIKGFLYRYFGLFKGSQSEFMSTYKTFEIRSNIYIYLSKLIKNNPFIGVGFGNYSAHYAIMAEEAESSILNSFVEGGIIFGIAHIGLYATLLYKLIKLVQSTSKNISNKQMLCLLIIYFPMLIMNDYMTLFYWIFLGLILGRIEQSKISKNELVNMKGNIK